MAKVLSQPQKKAKCGGVYAHWRYTWLDCGKKNETVCRHYSSHGVGYTLTRWELAPACTSGTILACTKQKT